jgi:hypothetical protein
MSIVLYIESSGNNQHFTRISQENSMNSTPTKPRSSRPALAIVVALAAAALMIVAAWFKRSAPAGSLSKELLEVTVGLLMIVALFVPYLAVPMGRAKNK